MGSFPSVLRNVIPENHLFTDSHRHTRHHVMQPSTGTRAWRTAGSAGTHAGMRRSPHCNNCRPSSESSSLCFAEICLLLILPSEAHSPVQEALTLHPHVPERCIRHLGLSCPLLQCPHLPFLTSGLCWRITGLRNTRRPLTILWHNVWWVHRTPLLDPFYYVNIVF